MEGGEGMQCGGRRGHVVWREERACSVEGGEGM